MRLAAFLLLAVIGGHASASCLVPVRDLPADLVPSVSRQLDVTGSVWSDLEDTAVLAITVERMLDTGHYAEAIVIAEAGAACAVDDPLLLQLRGEALLRAAQNGKLPPSLGWTAEQALDRAEAQFMQVLRLRPIEPAAVELIREIRTTRESMTSRASQEWGTVARDKIGDLVLLVVAFVLGTVVFQRIVNEAQAWLDRRSALGCLAQGEGPRSYARYAELLERMVARDRLRDARGSLTRLSSSVPLAVAREHLRRHIDSPERLQTLQHIMDGIALRGEWSHEQEKSNDA